VRFRSNIKILNIHISSVRNSQMSLGKTAASAHNLVPKVIMYMNRKYSKINFIWHR